MSMSQKSTDLVRNRLALWLLATIAVGYASYTMYRSYANHSTGIRRSNAVHRARRNRDGHRIDWVPPTPDAPLGTILIQKDDETLAINLAITPLPSADHMRAICGPGSEAMRREMQSLTLDMILSSSFASVRDPESRAGLSTFGFDDLLSALMTRDGQNILQASYGIPAIMHLDSITSSDVDRAVHILLTSHPSFCGSTSGSEVEYADLPETEDWDMEKSEPSQGLRGLLYYIAENEAKSKAYQHRGIVCEECGELPIRGVRWHCLNCPDFDLCSSCESQARHPKTHVFAKVKIPVPVLSQPTRQVKLWYPGDPGKIHTSLDTHTKKRLCQEYDCEEPQLEAIYDQFTCLSNVPWEQDPLKVKSAVDRRAFNKAMTSDRWPPGLATNAMFDRMFAFYDTDNNGLIGFEEFVNGMAYLRGPKRFASLRRTIQGYDIDDDGYVNRADFLRILRAKHAIQKQLISDQIDYHELERISAGMDTIRSSQPISSIFADEQIPQGEFRQPRGKGTDIYGDLQPLSDTKTVLDDDFYFQARMSAPPPLSSTFSRIDHLAELPGAFDPGGEVREIGEPPNMYNDALDETAIEDPYLGDVLWHITESGFHQLLDPLFQAREQEDNEIGETRAEREMYRAEIDAATKAENPSSMVGVTAEDVASSPGERPPTLPPRSNIGISDIALTDWTSLEAREAPIAEAPLEDLLSNLGCGLRDEAEESPSNARIAHSDSCTIWDGLPAHGATSPLRMAIASDDVTDPALPQNRLTKQESISAPEDDKVTTTPAVRIPPKPRLLRLARLNNLEREMNTRGGPGRLGYDEIERVVVSEDRRELRGMVKSWLEWASF